MNWLLPVIAAFLLLSAWDGHRKGLIKKSVGIVSFIITLLITSVSVPYITAFLREKTSLYEALQNAFLSADADIFQILEVMGLDRVMGGYLADMILQVIAFLATLLTVGLLVWGIAFSLGIAAKLPVLNGLNRLAGMIFGFAEGILFVWIFFFLVTVFSSTEFGAKALWMIADSEALSWLYRSNLLFAFLQF